MAFISAVWIVRNGHEGDGVRAPGGGQREHSGLVVHRDRFEPGGAALAGGVRCMAVGSSRNSHHVHLGRVYRSQEPRSTCRKRALAQRESFMPTTTPPMLAMAGR